MKTFTCQCGNKLHFANTKCVNCGLTLGFLPDDGQLSAFTRNQNGFLQASSNCRVYRQCKNYVDWDICNWMIPIEDENELCASCRLTQTIPNLSFPENKLL